MNDVIVLTISWHPVLATVDWKLFVNLWNRCLILLLH